jgi:hypothetical protein
MPTKSVKRKIKGQSAVNVQNTKDKNESIETVTPPSHEDQEDKIKESSKKRRVNKTELVLSPTRRSPRLLTQKSRFTHKPALKLALSPSLPIHNSRPVSTLPQLPPPLPALPPSLPINTRNSQYQQPRSAMETSPSYHTAPASPIESTPDLSMPVKSPMTQTKEKIITTENEATSFIREIPSSLPWENTPSDGYGDAWPPSQDSPKSSQHKTPTHNTQPRYNDGFRVPDPPSSRSGLDDTQDESQASQLRSPLSRVGSLQHSPPKPASQHRQTTTLRIPDPIIWSKEDLDDTQDDSQLGPPAPIRKRKREGTINEIPDSIPSDDSQPISSPLISHSKVQEDSLVVLSQAPAFMRRKTPEIITIHTTQSQSQEYITAPGPRATSQSLSQPFARTNSDDSQVSYIHPPQHNWASSQPTQSSIDPIMDMNPMNPPSQHSLSSQNDFSRIPEPLAMTLDHGIPRKKSYDDWVDLDEMERLQDVELQKWEAETNYRLKRKDKT